ncbi:MAG: hypothetical protein K6G83_04790 [Lachnospiraceae bacterium]|nr:hypothetical protein [Lachnospiraceae bacterium]
MMEKKKITLGMFLDTISRNRSSHEIIRIMDKNGEVDVSARVSSLIWESLEDRIIECFQAEEMDVFNVWLLEIG